MLTLLPFPSRPSPPPCVQAEVFEEVAEEVKAEKAVVGKVEGYEVRATKQQRTQQSTATCHAHSFPQTDTCHLARHRCAPPSAAGCP